MQSFLQNYSLKKGNKNIFGAPVLRSKKNTGLEKSENESIREQVCIAKIKNYKTKTVLSTVLQVYLLVVFLLPVDRFGRRLLERGIVDQGKENSLQSEN